MRKINNPWICDPFRCLMEFRIAGKIRYALLAALTLSCFMFFRVMFASLEGIALIALIGALCTLILMIGLSAAVGNEPQPLVFWLCCAVFSAAAVSAHLGMLTITPGRYGKVIKPLLEELWNYDLMTGMAWEDGNWAPGYMIIMALLSRVEHFSTLYAVKLIDLVAQSLLAAAACKLVLLRKGGIMGAAAAMAACMVAPSVLMNIGCWAQCDSLFAMLMLWGLAMFLDDKPVFGSLFWGAALAFKLQSAFLFPLLIPMFMHRKVSLRHLLILALTVFVFHLPILLDGQGLEAVFTRYTLQLADAREAIGLKDNAPGVYSLMNIASVREFSGMGLYLGIASALMTALALCRSRKTPDADCWLMGAALLAAGLPLILPQMNARCLFLGGMLIFCGGRRPMRMIAALLLETVSFLCVIRSIFGSEQFSLVPLSLMAIAAAVLIAVELIDRLKETPEAAHEA